LTDFLSSIGLNEDQIYKTGKALDKKPKISDGSFIDRLKEAGLNEDQLENLLDFINNPEPKIRELQSSSYGAKEVAELLDMFKKVNKDMIVKYDPVIMRGFDYYTGNVFEAFDLNENNPRSLCGGGRYDDLIQLFTGEKLTGVGFGMGDVTIQNFIENWNLDTSEGSRTDYFVTLWPDEDISKSILYQNISREVAMELRQRGKDVIEWLETGTKLEKQLKYADKRKVRYSVLIGEQELINGSVTIKDMENNSQESVKITDLLKRIEVS
jgi:histidyl-tRNA synthetase